MYEKRHRINAAGQMSVSICLLRRVNWSAISSMPAICGAWEAIRGNLKLGSERIPVHDFENDFSDDKLRDSVGIKPRKIGCLNRADYWGCHIGIILCEEALGQTPMSLFVPLLEFNRVAPR
jgi:hypothetical protein